MRCEIDKSGVRNKLAERKEPYWGAPVERGLYVGFRKLAQGGNWIARYRDEDGTHKYTSLGQVSAERDYDVAKAEARRWMKQIVAGVKTTDVKTVADACREYVKDRRKVKGDACADDAEQRFEREVYTSTLGALPLDRVRQKRIEEWRDNLIERKKKPVGKASANRTLTSLKAALALAVAHRYVSAERVIEWKLAKPFAGASRRRDLYLDRDQRRALLDAATGAVRDLIEAAMLTGARAGELVNALRGQFDARTKSITFSGKTGSRTVPLSPAAVDLFSRVSKSKLPGAFLLTRDDGERWAHSDWDELVREAAAKAELPPGVCLYTLRHSWITQALTGGMSVLEVAKLCGTSLQMIQRFYGHLHVDGTRERLAAVAML
jgi:integrase